MRILIPATAAVVLTVSALGQPVPTWRALPALNGEASALLVTSGSEAGGNGSPMLWVAGDFTHTGGASAGRAARFNGASWQGVGAFDWEVTTLAEHQGRIYAGGFFSVPGAAPNTIDSVASFTGSGWQALGAPGYLLSWCSKLASYQLPGEPAKLLVSGSPAGSDNYARALGPSGWEDVGGTFITLVDSALVHDDGSGPELFTTNGTFNGANKFNGTRRAALGGNCFSSARCLTVWGEGPSRRLYMGGNLAVTAGLQVAGAASWNGTAWSGMGGTGWGVRRANGGPGWVHALVPWDDGSGEKLWALGFFDSVGGPTAAERTAAQSVAAWDGASWSLPGAGGVTGIPADGSFLNGIKAAVAFDFDGPGGRPPSLVIAGKFTGAGGVAVSNFAVLDAAWCGVADVGRQGGIAGHDGRLDNNDFVAFVELFFAGDARADLGAQGGVPGRDGSHDNNDFVVLVDAFFDGCAG